ncbi:MAG: FAD-dependent oxidoreductase [Acidobacteriota bacterium]
MSRNSDCSDATTLKVAVVGAGISGLVCARTLSDLGHQVRVIDKARGPGGRMSTRRADVLRYDHGAQYFTVSDPRFAAQIESWQREGVVEPWDGTVVALEPGGTRSVGRTTVRFVGVPGMNAVCQRLADEFDVTLNTEIRGLDRHDGLWTLTDAEGTQFGAFDFVVVSAPAPQTEILLCERAPKLAARAQQVEMAPCWAVMVTFSQPLDLGWDAAFVSGSPLSWIARNASKPGRPDHESWVLHASPEWSRRFLELDPAAVSHRLVRAFCDAVGGIEPSHDHADAHRWRFSLPVSPLPEICLIDADIGVATCGDWCGGPRVEGAFLSGLSVAHGIHARRPGAAHASNDESRSQGLE